MPDVVAQVEVVVVDPHRMPLERNVRDPLPVARDPVQARRDVAADSLDVDAAVGGGERTRVEDRDPAEVHVRVLVLEDQVDERFDLVELGNDIVTGDMGGPAGGFGTTGEHADGGGLAGAVVAEQAEDFAALR